MFSLSHIAVMTKICYLLFGFGIMAHVPERRLSYTFIFKKANEEMSSQHFTCCFQRHTQNYIRKPGSIFSVQSILSERATF